jgi:hypothetical protein
VLRRLLTPLLLLLCAPPAVGQPVHPQPPAAEPVPVAPAPAEPAAPDGKFPRGLKGPTPAAKVLAAPRFTAKSDPLAFAAAPAQFSVPPPVLRMWGNNQYGCCVSSEEAFALSTYTYYCTKSQVCPSDAEVIAFARQHGYLNGAWLTEVMDTMQTSGMAVGGKNYKIGPYSSVNYTNPTELKAALYAGPVNIAIDSNALPGDAGSKQGWYTLKAGRYGNTDHCVGLGGYGPAAFLYQSLGVPLPAGLPADKEGYLLFTWSTLGFVTQEWLNGTCVEAWVRVPTAVGFSPPSPQPDPTPNPPTPGPGPGPNPTPGAKWNGTYAETTTWTIRDGVKLPTPVVTSAYTTDEDKAVEGVNPATLAAVLKLLVDVRRKAGPEVIRQDIINILLTLGIGDDPFQRVAPMPARKE